MSKSSNARVYFSPGEQVAVIERALDKSGISVNEMAVKLCLSPRTIRDWKREKYNISYKGLKVICKSAQMELPKNLDVRDAYSHTSKAGVLGSAAVKKKYGKAFPCDPAYRQQQWRRWWNRVGKHNPPPQSQPTPIYKPKPSVDLAEFIGILIGDGSITKYQVTITLNRTDDHAYSIYVQKLCKKLFKIQPSVYRRTDDNTVNIVISRSPLVKFLGILGLQQGDKIRYGVTIPNWIQQNDRYLKKCLRGIFDTDGGIFLETHRIKLKKYSYMRLAFVSASKPLIETLHESLKKFNFNPKIRSGKRVQLEKKDEIVHYFQVIGSSNPKHLTRFKRMKEGWQRG